MKRLALNLAAALLAFAASTAAAQNAKVYAIHGIPGGDIGAAPALPVDISVNGGCVLTNFQFGQIRGPLSLPAGNYTFEIKLNLGGAPCSGPTAIGPAVIPFGAGETATVIAHLTEGGAPTASKFVNDVSGTGAGRARIVAHHTAAAPAVDVFVSRDLYDPTAPTVSIPELINGQQAAAPVRPGAWQVALKLAGTNTIALGPTTLRLKPFTAYYVYAVGSATTGSLTFLVNTIGDLKKVPLVPVPTAITVTNLDDSGAGSLRAALGSVADGGTIIFDPALAGGTLVLISGPLLVSKSFTIDAAAAPGIAVSGNGGDRVLIVDAGRTVTVRHLALRYGYGFQLAGCVLNNGSLTLDHVTVSNCQMATDAGDFWQGGGGIYNGAGASLHLLDSTVSNNSAQWSGGGVYSYFNTSTVIERSTISGNVANDVGGGLRLLGNATIVNSTISGNQSTGWYGGALFVTDGVVDMLSSTVTGNVSPPFAPAAVFVGTFTAASATLNLTSSIVADNVTEGCFLAPFGAGAVALNSLGNNLFTDGTCFPVGSDVIVAPGAAGIGALADNGGPTLTQALQAGSPAIDTASAAACPATDQRGVVRPQGVACDVGAFERVD